MGSASQVSDMEKFLGKSNTMKNVEDGIVGESWYGSDELEEMDIGSIYWQEYKGVYVHLSGMRFDSATKKYFSMMI